MSESDTGTSTNTDFNKEATDIERIEAYEVEVIDPRDANGKNAKFPAELNDEIEEAVDYLIGVPETFAKTFWINVLDTADHYKISAEDCDRELRYQLRQKGWNKQQVYYFFHKEQRKLDQRQRRLEQKRMLETAKQLQEQQDDDKSRYVTTSENIEDAHDEDGRNVATSVQQPQENSAQQPQPELQPRLRPESPSEIEAAEAKYRSDLQKFKAGFEEETSAKLSQDAEHWEALYDDLANSIEGKDIEHWNNRFGEQVKVLEKYKQKFADNYASQFLELATENDFLRKRHHQNEDCYRLLLKLYDNPDSSDALIAAVMKDFVKSWYPNYGAEIRKELEQQPEYLELKEYGIIETKAKEKHDLELKRKEATEYVRQQKAAKEKKSKRKPESKRKSKPKLKSKPKPKSRNIKSTMKTECHYVLSSDNPNKICRKPLEFEINMGMRKEQWHQYCAEHVQIIAKRNYIGTEEQKKRIRPIAKVKTKAKTTLKKSKQDIDEDVKDLVGKALGDLV